jgi:virulence-associated protein VapD
VSGLGRGTVVGSKRKLENQDLWFESRRVHSLPMSRTSKIYEKLMAAQSDANFSFDDLRYLLQKLGFEIRKTKGSYLIAQKGMSFHNLQEKKGKAKSYQVAQVGDDLKKFNIKPE